MTLLDAGDPFPHLTIDTVASGPIDLPDLLAGRYATILFNRGSWCPYCNAQLRAFQRELPALESVGATVVSLSADDESTAREMVERNHLTFPVGHSADVRAIGAATGAFTNAEPPYLQSTGFVLDPSGSVVVSAYSSGAIGRLVPEDVLGLIRYVRERAQP